MERQARTIKVDICSVTRLRNTHPSMKSAHSSLFQPVAQVRLTYYQSRSLQTRITVTLVRLRVIMMGLSLACLCE